MPERNSLLRSEGEHSQQPGWTSQILARSDHGSHFGLREFLRALFRRRWLVALFALGVMLTLTLGAFLKPPEYEATASILVKKGTAREPLSPREAPVTVSDELDQQDLNTEIGILESRPLIAWATAAISQKDALPPPEGLYESEPEAGQPDAYSQTDVVFQERVDEAADALSVEQRPKSNIIHLRFVWPNREQGLQFLQTLVEGYQARRAELFESSGAEPFFRRQAALAASELESTERQLQAFLNASGITLIEGGREQDALAAEKQSALEQQSRINTDLGETRARVRQLEEQAAQIRSQLASEMSLLDENLLERQRAALRTELNLIERDAAEQRQRLNRLRELRAQVGEKLAHIRVLEDRLRGLLLRDQGSRDAKQLRAEIDEIYRQLADLGQHKRYDLNVGQDTSLYEHLETSILETEVQLTGLRERADAVSRQYEALEQATNKGQAPLLQGDLQQAIERTRKALSSSSTLLDMADRAALSEPVERLISMLQETESALSGARARAQELEDQARASAEALSALNVKSTRAKELRRELMRIETDYLTYLQKSETAAIAQAMAKEELINTSIAEPPMVGVDPVGPSTLMILLVGLVLSSVGGMGLVLILEHFDQGIDTPEQLERQLGLRHLASVAEGEPLGPLDIGLSAASTGDWAPPSIQQWQRLTAPA